MNNLKQTWKEFIVWWMNDLNLSDMKIKRFNMSVTTYMPTRRRSDPDNCTPKFILDGMTESGFLYDDDGIHLKKLSLSTNYDKDHPRTEILIEILDKENTKDERN